MSFTQFNPYLLRVKGNALIDRLTLEQSLDAPGCVLAGVKWIARVR